MFAGYRGAVWAFFRGLVHGNTLGVAGANFDRVCALVKVGLPPHGSEPQKHRVCALVFPSLLPFVYGVTQELWVVSRAAERQGIRPSEFRPVGTKNSRTPFRSTLDYRSYYMGGVLGAWVVVIFPRGLSFWRGIGGERWSGGVGCAASAEASWDVMGLEVGWLVCCAP